MLSVKKFWLVSGGFIVFGLIFSLSGFASDLSEYQKANINWQQKSGERLLVGMNKHGFTDAASKLLPQFEKLTGIKVTFDVYPEEEFRKKRLVAMAGGGGIYDVFMIDQVLFQYAEAGWVEPLLPYVNNSKLTDPKWFDFEDIFEKARAFGTYKGKFYGMPITGEAEILFYRKDLFIKYGLTVPKTMDELHEAAVKLKGKGIAGIVLRGARGWGMNVWPWSGFLWSYGGKFFDEAGNPIFNSPEGIAATEMYAKLLQDGGPKGPASYTWYEVQSDLAMGKTAMGIDSGMFMALCENPDKSVVAGKMGYAMLPRVPGKELRPNFWYWMIGIDSHSMHKEAAWLFIEWLMSKPTALRIALECGASPRAWVWKHPDFLAKYPKDWAEASSKSLAIADPSLVPYYIPEFPEFGEAISIAITDVITAKKTAKEALDWAAKETRRILKR